MHIFEHVFFWTTAVCYVATGLIHAYWFILRKKSGFRLEQALIFTGFFSNLVAIGLRFFISGHLPVIVKYDASLVIAAMTVGLFLVWRGKKESLMKFGLVCLPFAVLVLFIGVGSPTDIDPLSAVYQSRWLLVHSVFTAVGTVCFVFALGAGISYLLKERNSAGDGRSWLDSLPSLEVLGDLSFRLVLYGFLCWTIMLISGSLWVKDLWGTYWTWDPIETWSLFSWLVWAIYIHLYFVQGWRGRRQAWLSIFSFIVSIISIWGVELVTPNTYHNFDQIITTPWTNLR